MQSLSHKESVQECVSAASFEPLRPLRNAEYSLDSE